MSLYKGFVAGSQVKPPTLVDLIRRWCQEDPILHSHFFTTYYEEGMYIESGCPNDNDTGIALALIPSEKEPDQRIYIYSGMVAASWAPSKQIVQEHLKKEDPKFIPQLKRALVRGHNKLWCNLCKI